MNKQEILRKHLGQTPAEFQDLGKKNTLDAMEEYAQLHHESKVENLGLFSVSNSALLIMEASKVLLKFDYTPTLGQEWLLAEKGKMTVLHRGKSKEELVNYVIEHYC